MDKISIIIPVYNMEKYLDRCILSLLNQTYTNCEYIFVNDGSTDSSIDILKKYQKNDDRIVIIDKKNTGVSDSRNMAIKKATGEYICFCDADDYYDSNYVDTMHNVLITEGCSAVRCNYNVVNEEEQIVSHGSDLHEGLYDANGIKNEVIPRCLDGSVPCFSYLLMIKKEFLKVLFPTDIAMMEDVVFCVSLFLSIDSLYVLNKPLYVIMYNSNGATNNVSNYKRNINNVVLVNSRIKKLLEENDLLSNSNVEKLNTNNLNAIADFVFNYYLFGNNWKNFCKEVSSNDFLNLIKSTDLAKLNLVRRCLIKLLYKQKYGVLSVYLYLRKIVYHLKRR